MDCFPSQELSAGAGGGGGGGGVAVVGLDLMVSPPSVSGHSLTHEQVMPFLKKLEQGQLREGVS